MSEEEQETADITAATLPLTEETAVPVRSTTTSRHADRSRSSTQKEAQEIYCTDQSTWKRAKIKSREETKKPLKVERTHTPEAEDTSFSWSKEVAKAALLASLGLASVYVQQTFAQEKKPVVVQTTPTTTKDTTTPAAAPKKKAQQPSKDPFSGYRWWHVCLQLKKQSILLF